MRKRVLDVNGQIITVPNEYYLALQDACKMIDKLESENVDRSDMYAILHHLMLDISYHLTFLKCEEVS